MHNTCGGAIYNDGSFASATLTISDQAVDSTLANISTRGFVQTGEKVRGVGPSLSSFNLNPLLADPTLELHGANGTVMISNDDWTDDPVSASQLTANGLAPTDLKESGIFTMLPPGQFTVILAGKNGGIGIGLVEIYNLN